MKFSDQTEIFHLSLNFPKFQLKYYVTYAIIKEYEPKKISACDKHKGGTT